MAGCDNLQVIVGGTPTTAVMRIERCRRLGVIELILKAQGLWQEAIERFCHAGAAPGLRNGHGCAVAHVR